MRKFLLTFVFVVTSFVAHAQNPQYCVTSPSLTADFNRLCMSASSSGGSLTVTNFGSATGGLSIGPAATNSIALPATTSSSIGVVTVGGVPFLHSYGNINLFIGSNSGNFTTTGTGGNLGIGNLSLNNLSTGINNVAIGDHSLFAVTTANYNTAIGALALGQTTTVMGVAGRNNTGVGVNALGAVTSGAFNVGIGSDVGPVMTTGGDNVCIGYISCGGILTGNYNTMIGSNIITFNAAQSNTTIIADGQGNIEFGCNYPTVAACTVGFPIVSTGVAYSALPVVAGTIAYITDAATGNCADSTCTTFGTSVTGGGGSLKKLIWYNGTNWKLIGS